MDELTKNEEALLISILYLGDKAYGINIREQVQKQIDKQLNYGTLYRMLDQLAKKQLLQKVNGAPMPERGGRRKIFYQLTPQGQRALKAAHARQRSLWEGYEQLASH